MSTGRSDHRPAIDPGRHPGDRGGGRHGANAPLQPCGRGALDAATVYIEFFRGTSLLVQLYWIFFVLPLFGVTLDKFTAGFVAVGMNLGAYGAEVVRGCHSVRAARPVRGGARAQHVAHDKRMTRIILPQALAHHAAALGQSPDRAP